MLMVITWFFRFFRVHRNGNGGQVEGEGDGRKVSGVSDKSNGRYTELAMVLQ